MSVRHVNLVDLTAAVEARIRALCGLVRDIRTCQATTHDELLKIVAWEMRLPAAIVVLGPIEQPGQIGKPALAVRNINLGIMLVVEWSAQQIEGAQSLWAVEDEVNRAFLPATERGENLGLPVAVLGDQSGAGMGTLLLPAGSLPVTKSPRERAARIFQLIAVDWPRERDV